MDTNVERKALIEYSDTCMSTVSVGRKRSHSVKTKRLQEDKLNNKYTKRPKLVVDTSNACQPLCEALSSNESFSSTIDNSVTTGLSAYLEDIDSDEELDELEATPTPSPAQPHGKDELLLLMDNVDRDITTLEQVILSLEKKQKSLVEATETQLSNETPVAISDDSGCGQDKSTVESIYSENRLKSRTQQSKETWNVTLYYQPSEAPNYLYNIEKHKQLRPDLLKYIRAKKLDQCQKEHRLCQEYDKLMESWEKKVEKWEKGQKKRNRDTKSRDLFERTFPELRSKSDQLRDQAERFNNRTGGVRSFGVVRSEAELNELAFELFEQEEARGRHRITHAVIPSMLLDRNSEYINTNGLLRDPMLVYRETKSSPHWTDNEKALFREKFQLFPKNFDKISSYIPNKSVNDCVRYYYLAKKAGNFKSLSRRSAYKRRRHIPKSHDYTLSSQYLIDQSKAAKQHVQYNNNDIPSLPTTAPPTPATPTTPQNKDAVTWSKEEIDRLKDGLRVYGRAWGRVYRHVGGLKTATQCKQFYDDYCTNPDIELNSALAEHSARKNAERIEKKMAEMKKTPSRPSTPPPTLVADGSSSDSDVSAHTTSNGDNQESDSETTLTDSGQEEEDDDAVEDSSFIKPKLNPLNLSNNSQTTNDPSPSLQSPLDIFLSAAEALSNTVPSDIALHDHTYSYPPLDIQGGSGLQLIAAAAAVVSPSLSRSTWNCAPSPVASTKSTLSHTVKAPRGRPPNAQKRSSTNSQRIGPSYLTPTGGVSQNVLLQELKPSLRGRSRSAPTDKPRPPIMGKNPPVASSLLLKSGTSTAKILATPYSATTKGGVASPLTYSRVKDMKQTTEQLNMTSSTATDTRVHVPSVTPSNTNIQPKVTAARNNSKDNTNNNNPAVLELNLGNMALLLAAGSHGNQATLFLPPSSLFNNKHTLAVLHSGSLAGDSNSLTVNSPSSFAIAKHTPTISIDLSKTTNADNAIPLAVPVKPTQIAAAPHGKQTLKLSLSSSKVKPHPTVSLPAISLKATTNKSISSAPVTPAATPTTDDLSNLNLLSNLVAGMSDKTSSSSTVVNKSSNPSTTITNNAPINSKVDIKASKLATWENSSNTVTSSTSSYSSTSTQQSLMLYTSSLPIKSKTTTVSSPDEEDHLEYATRGIDELSRLLGGSSSSTVDDKTSVGNNSMARSSSLWSPDELLCNPFGNSETGADKSVSKSSFLANTAFGNDHTLSQGLTTHSTN